MKRLKKVEDVRAIKCAVTLTFTECLPQCLYILTCVHVYSALLIVDLICFAAFDANVCPLLPCSLPPCPLPPCAQPTPLKTNCRTVEQVGGVRRISRMEVE